MPNVLLSTNTVGAEIRYSTDGNDVTEESTLYSGQFSVEAGATVKAKAFKTGMNPSPQSTLQSFAKLQTPTVSLSRNGSVITIALGNTVEGATYRYKVGSAPTSPTDGTAITGSATLDNSSALTIYVVGWKTGTYNPSDTAMDSVEQYVPTLQTPTLSLSRSGSTVTGTIGNTVTGATYVYKTGSAPSSQSDGTVISGTTFSFSNDGAVTVYVKGFMTGYNPSSAISKSVNALYPQNFTVIKGTLSDGGSLRDLEDIAYGNGVYVAVGVDSRIYYSYNLSTWTEINVSDLTEDATRDFNCVKFINNYFWACCDDGVLLYSSDGLNWYKVSDTTLGTGNVLNVEYGNGYFVITDSSNSARSTNGTGSWVSGPSIEGSASIDERYLFHFKGFFYLTASDGLYRSSDGLNWSKVDVINQLSLPVISGFEWYVANAVCSDSMIVIQFVQQQNNTITNNADMKFAYSTDGLNFTLATGTDVVPKDLTYNMAYGNGVFLLVRNDSYTNVEFYYTKDGINYYSCNSTADTTESIQSLRYINGRFVTCGDEGEICYAVF